MYSINNAIGTYGKSDTALSLPLKQQIGSFIATFMPQGWGFFTADPRMEQQTIYQYEPSTEKTSLAYWGPNSNIRNFLGFGRVGRIQAAEISVFIASIAKKDWIACNSIEICNKEAQKNNSVTISNKVSHPFYCGEYILIKNKMLSWTWKREGFKEKYYAAKVNIQC